MTRQVNKDEQLGMPFSRASHRLKKMIMFDLAQRLGLDDCFRCEGKIESHVDLSIDHRVDWLHADPDLFWSMDNIAFSHLSCNTKGAGRPRECTVCGSKDLVKGRLLCQEHHRARMREVMRARRNN